MPTAAIFPVVCTFNFPIVLRTWETIAFTHCCPMPSIPVIPLAGFRFLAWFLPAFISTLKGQRLDLRLNGLD